MVELNQGVSELAMVGQLEEIEKHTSGEHKEEPKERIITEQKEAPIDYVALLEYSNGLLQKSYGLYQWVDVKTASLSTINGILLAAFAVVFKDISSSTISSLLTILSFIFICSSIGICLFEVLPSMKSRHEKKIKSYGTHNNLRAVTAIDSFTYEAYRAAFLASTPQSRLDNNIFQISQMSCIINRDQRFLKIGAFFTFCGVMCFSICFLIFSAKNIFKNSEKKSSQTTIVQPKPPTTPQKRVENINGVPSEK